jgi:hypothetical protein
MEIVLRIKQLNDKKIDVEKASVVYYYENDVEEEQACVNNELPSPKKK